MPLPLSAYRLTARWLGLFSPLLLSHRLKQGKEIGERLGERRGRATAARPEGLLVWLHGASVGELASVYPLIERISAQNIEVLVTSGTVTSATIAAERLPARARHQFIPLDAPKFVDNFLDHWQPDLALIVESDLWPNLILGASERDIPIIMLNGRLSDRSFARWQQFPRTIGALLERFDLCLARTSEDARRYSALGAPRVVMAGNLKLDVPAPPVHAQALAEAEALIGRRPVIAATSTHPGENEIVIDVHRRLAAQFPDLLTIIAPRHPEHGQTIGDLAFAAGLRPAIRSRGELPDARTGIYVADSIGELGLIYRLAPIALIGGSLVKHGGQNPIEAAKLGVAVMHGPHVWNFTDIYGVLDARAGAIPVDNAATIAAQCAIWLTNEQARRRVADTGKAVVEALGGALEKTSQALDPYFMQLRLGMRGQNAQNGR